MALDPRISMGVQVPDISNTFSIFQDAMEKAKGIERRDAAAPLQQQLLEQQASSGAAQASDERNTRRLSNLHQTGQRLKPFLESGDAQGAQNFLLNNISQLQSRIESGEDLDITESMEALQKLQQGDLQGVLSDVNAVEGLVLGRNATSAGSREFTELSRLAAGDPESDTTKAARIKLGLDPRASLSAGERTALDSDLGQKVVEQKAAEAGATESAKSKSELKFKPQITRAVKLAEKEAAEKGEVLTDLARMEASLPGVKEVVNELLELSDIATSTLGGKAFDFVVKQSGFGATKGADAKAKMVAIVDNQVLPLLKETFGAAFTVQEGDNLKASLVDPDASPSQKRVQLESFLAQKERNIRTKQSQLGQEAPTEAGINEFAGFKVIR